MAIFDGIPMYIYLLVALFVHEKTNFFIRLVGHQIGCTMLPSGIKPRFFLLTHCCTTTRVMHVTVVCRRKDHLQTKGRVFFRNLTTLAAQQPNGGVLGAWDCHLGHAGTFLGG